MLVAIEIVPGFVLGTSIRAIALKNVVLDVVCLVTHPREHSSQVIAAHRARRWIVVHVLPLVQIVLHRLVLFWRGELTVALLTWHGVLAACLPHLGLRKHCHPWVIVVLSSERIRHLRESVLGCTFFVGSRGLVKLTWLLLVDIGLVCWTLVLRWIPFIMLFLLAQKAIFLGLEGHYLRLFVHSVDQF